VSGDVAVLACGRAGVGCHGCPMLTTAVRSGGRGCGGSVEVGRVGQPVAERRAVNVSRRWFHWQDRQTSTT
jgi:hypothetical protein